MTGSIGPIPENSSIPHFNSVLLKLVCSCLVSRHPAMAHSTSLQGKLLVPPSMLPVELCALCLVRLSASPESHSSMLLSSTMNSRESCESPSSDPFKRFG
jgi:hypothetical protein